MVRQARGRDGEDRRGSDRARKKPGPVPFGNTLLIGPICGWTKRSCGRGSTRSSTAIRPSVWRWASSETDLSSSMGAGSRTSRQARRSVKDTVFRIGSITKVFTAIAVMQLCEEGLVDLDAPAGNYLRSYELVLARAGFRPPTLRHLLTHTSGIPEVRHIFDLFHPDLSVKFGEPLPSLAEYYRGGLRVVAQPGTVFAYSNHGFATLGQIIEDVSGTTLERYFQERIFQPLGMSDTGLVRSAPIGARLATGYTLGRRGAQVVPDRDWIGAAVGGMYSTTSDIARFAAALMRGGTNGHGPVLDPRRWRGCSTPTTGPILAFRGGGSDSSGPRPARIAWSGTTGSFRASTPSSWWPPTTASASSPSPTGRRGRSCGCRPS